MAALENPRLKTTGTADTLAMVACGRDVRALATTTTPMGADGEVAASGMLPTAAWAKAGGYPRYVQLILEHGAAALRPPPEPLPSRRERVQQMQRRQKQLQERKNAKASGAELEFSHKPPMVSALQAARARKVFRMEGWYVVGWWDARSCFGTSSLSCCLMRAHHLTLET